VGCPFGGMAHVLRTALTRVGVSASHPLAFVVVVAYVACWLIFQPQTLEWHGVATIATWVMTLFIQRAEHRDTQAIHAKLDELLRAEASARNALTNLDDEEPEEIEEHRIKERHP
jgi:low affinity Fe/Cu permease